MPTMFAVQTQSDSYPTVARSLDHAMSVLCPDRGQVVYLRRVEAPSGDPAEGLQAVRTLRQLGLYARLPCYRLPRRYVRRTLAPARSDRYTLRILGDGYPVAEYSYTGAAVLGRVLDRVIRSAGRRGVGVALVVTEPSGRTSTITAYPLPNGRVDLDLE